MQSLLAQAVEKRLTGANGEIRNMGVEIELAGVEPVILAELVIACFGGRSEWQSPFEILINDTELGDFKLELDSSQIKELGKNSKVAGNPKDEPKSFDRIYIESISNLAVSVVPWEIVSPPVPLDKITRLYDLVDKLRDAGAKGTRDALHFAFGVHLNPELVDHEPATIVRHLQSFFCLYDWVKVTERTDILRRITPYIDHFDSNYQMLVLADDYQPDQATLIDDYLQHNPSRNRSLDMLPLFKWLDEKRVSEAIGDERVNARPTFHYRLPNCDIGEPGWNLNLCIEMWMAIEALAHHDGLRDLRREHRNNLEQLLPTSSKSWSQRVTQQLTEWQLMPSAVKHFS